MNQFKPNPADDVDLARAFLASSHGQNGQVNLLELAAWLDGHLSEDEAAEVESQLAGDPDWRAFASEYRLHGPPAQVDVDPGILARAQAIPVDDEAPITLGRIHPWWAASGVAAAIAIAVLGFLTGKMAASGADAGNARMLAVATFDVFSDDESALDFDQQFLELTGEEVVQ